MLGAVKQEAVNTASVPTPDLPITSGEALMHLTHTLGIGKIGELRKTSSSYTGPGCNRSMTDPEGHACSDS